MRSHGRVCKSIFKKWFRKRNS